MRRWQIVGFLLILLFVVCGCNHRSAVNWEVEGDPFEKIKVEIKNQRETDEGTSYDLIIHNGTIHDILQMKVALSYQINTENGAKSNNERIEADRVLKVIEAGSYGEVNILMPTSYGYGRNWDNENVEIHMEGYFEALMDGNQFGMSGNIDAYMVEGDKPDSKVQSMLTSDEQLREIQNPMFELIIEEGVIDAIGCGVMKDDAGDYYLYLEVREEEGIDYDDYREHLYQVMGAEFPLSYELIPFPEAPTFHGLIYDINGENDYQQEDFIGNILMFSTKEFLNDQSPDAVWATITEETEIVDQNGMELHFEDLEEGMTISSYYRGLTLTTYPGHQGCEKLVVDMDAVIDIDGVPLKSKMVLGEGGIIQDGVGYNITLEMAEGNYKWKIAEDGLLKSGWTGNCQLVLSSYVLAENQELSTYDLSTDWPEGMVFHDPFTIYTEDYDSNGITEVLIGQYDEPKTFVYQLYGVSEDGIFRYGGYEMMKMTSESGSAYSTVLNTEDHQAWSYAYYDDEGNLQPRIIRFDGKNIVFIGEFSD